MHKIHEIYGYEIFSCDAWTLEAYEDKRIIKQLDDVFFCLKNGVIDKKIIKDMADIIVHRGPDSDGYYVNDKVALGFRRLSIIDLFD